MAQSAIEKKARYEKEIIEVIKENNIYSILDIFAFYPGCSRETLYYHDLHKSDKIKNAIDDNKVLTKQTLKSKWAKSDNPALQIALFKTICTNDERKAISQTYQENNQNIIINPTEFTIIDGRKD